MLKLIRSHEVYERALQGSEFVLKGTALNHHPISKVFESISDRLSVATSFIPVKSLKIHGTTIFTRESQNFHHRARNSGTLTVDADSMLSHATAAPFGKGNQTIVDPNVRKALEVPASAITFEVPHENSAIDMFLETLAPHGKKLVPKLYKLHIYQEGGFFLDHQDTLHASNHYATLLIGLPFEHEGGELVFKDGGHEDIHYMKDGSAVLFLTDVVHSVRKVTKGIRAVLQFDVYMEDADKSGVILDEAFEYEGDDEFLDEECDYESSECNFSKSPSGLKLFKSVDEVENALIPVLKSFRKERPKDSMHFLLNHQYASGVDLSCLKGADRILVEVLSKHYNLCLALAINTFAYGDQVNDKGKLVLSVFSDPMIRLAEHYVETGVKKSFASKDKNFIFFGRQTDFYKEKYTPYMEYTGNESQQGECAYRNLVVSICSEK